MRRQQCRTVRHQISAGYLLASSMLAINGKSLPTGRVYRRSVNEFTTAAGNIARFERNNVPRRPVALQVRVRMNGYRR